MPTAAPKAKAAPNKTLEGGQLQPRPEPSEKEEKPARGSRHALFHPTPAQPLHATRANAIFAFLQGGKAGGRQGKPVTVTRVARDPRRWSIPTPLLRQEIAIRANPGCIL